MDHELVLGAQLGVVLVEPLGEGHDRVVGVSQATVDLGEVLDQQLFAHPFGARGRVGGRIVVGGD